MKVALVRTWYKTHIITPPLGMGYLAAYLKKFNHDTVIIDGLNDNLSHEQIIDKCKEFGAKLVGIYCLSAFFLDTAELVKKLNKNGIKTIMGGAHPSFLPQYTIERVPIDFIIVGEAEQTVTELATALENHQPTDNIPGVY